MASSSSTSSLNYDVFLSFRGEDTRKTFVSYLYKELVRMGIKTFRDDEDLRKGKSISPELLQAIGESKFAVVVISKNYASSGWCLNELLEIVKCQKNGSLTIVPVFYEVNPSDVKKQSGPFAESFQKHKDNPKVNLDKLQDWKDALTKVATIAGEDSRNWYEDSDLIEKIVGMISNRLISTTPSDFSDLVGMEDHMKALYNLLDLESTNDVSMIGLWGMPGVGKTTLARYVYETISHNFQARYFVEDVKKCYKQNGPTRLQELLLSKNHVASTSLRSSRVGSNVIKARLGHQKVLIVIDDVDTIEQLDVLARDTNWFGPGSRIIVTTQDKHLLDAHKVDHVYEVKCLSKHNALQLFCLYACKRKQPMKGFEQVSIQATNYAGGLPLALRVLGSFLCGRSKEHWKSSFRKLEISPAREIMDTLKIAYEDGLDEQEKSIFLHVACLFDGEDVEDLSRILDGEHEDAEIGIQTLVEKSFVDTSNGIIKVHGLLQKMGRELSRGWLLTDPKEISDALTNDKVNNKIEGISLNMSLVKKKELPISDGALKRKSNLKFLKVYNHGFNNEVEVQLASSIGLGDCRLKYFHWTAYPLRTLQCRLDNLIVLNMRASKLEKLWEGSLPLRSLKRIDLSGSYNLREIPDLSGAPNLEDLNASYCITPNPMDSKSLELWLLSCRRLKKFPQISQKIRKLRVTLPFEIELPNSIGNLSYLVELKLYNCTRLKTLPITIGKLRSLERMFLKECIMLASFPDTIEELECLTEFEVTRGRNIRKFPRLPLNLIDLKFTGTSIEEVPSWIGNLPKLQRLDLGENRRLKDLPDSVSELKCLNFLQLGSYSLRMSHHWPPEDISPLEDLDLSHTVIKGLPDNFGNLTSLKWLYVNQDLYAPDGEPRPCPPLAHFSLLISLELRNLNIKEVPNDIGLYFPHLKDLDLSGNDFQTLPVSIKHLSSLISLYINRCKNLRSLPEVSSRTTTIHAHGCVSLESASQALRYPVYEIVLSGCIRLTPKEARSLAQHFVSLCCKLKHLMTASLPLSKVPRGLKHHAKGPSLTMHLPTCHSLSDIHGVVTCIVVDVEHHCDISNLKVEYDYDVRDNNGHSVLWGTVTNRFSINDRLDFKSEHMFLFRSRLLSRPQAEVAFQDIHLSFSLNYRENGTLRYAKVKACGACPLFKGVMGDDKCDDNASTNNDETSDDEEPEGSNKKQELSMSSLLPLTYGESNRGLWVSSEEVKNIPDNNRPCTSGDSDRQESHELHARRGNFFKFLCCIWDVLCVFSNLFSH